MALALKQAIKVKAGGFIHSSSTGEDSDSVPHGVSSDI